MLRALINTACRWLQRWSDDLQPDRQPAPELFVPAAPPKTYRRLERVILADEVSRTLFGDYEAHRRGPRGDEEVGWVLLGLREEAEAIVLATLPAGADRQAGVAHVRFNSSAQALASRIVRQADRRLGIVGVVHTHPGSLRHPSDGDYQGDSLWVGRLRGGEGVFGIGTGDGIGPDERDGHVQAEGELCFSWYALGKGDKRYRRVPVEVAPGPDLARPLHPVWDAIERHADTVDLLCRQLAQVSFDVVEDGSAPALGVRLPALEPGQKLRLLFRPDEVRYYLEGEGGLTAVDPGEPLADRAVFLILAELARQRRREAEPDPVGSRSS